MSAVEKQATKVLYALSLSHNQSHEKAVEHINYWKTNLIYTADSQICSLITFTPKVQFKAALGF